MLYIFCSCACVCAFFFHLSRYPEFADDLVPKLAAPFLSGPAEEDKDDKDSLKRKCVF